MALYYPKGTEIVRFLGEREIKVNFELDVATEESIHREEDLRAFYREIVETQANLPPEMERGACLCAMCMRGSGRGA
jgi:hypothetical protein